MMPTEDAYGPRAAHCWKPIEVIVSGRLTAAEILDRIYTQIRLNATEAGDFVERVRLGTGRQHTKGCTVWSAAYLPGPPAAFPLIDSGQ